MEAKLDKIISEMAILASTTSNISQSVSMFQNMFTNLDNRINNVKASHRNLIDTVEASLQTRINTVEASFENVIRSTDLTSGKCCDKVHTALTEERKIIMDDLAEVTALMDMHCKEIWESEEAIKFMPTAVRFGMKNMAAKLACSLKNGLSFGNCIQVFQLASQYELDELWEASKNWISENFVSVSENASDFCQLTLDEMCVFVYLDTLSASEEDVFKAINKWANEDRIHRLTSCSILLRAVQPCHCTLAFLRSMLDHYLVFANPRIQKTVEEEIKQKAKEPDNIHCPSAVKRTDRNDVLFVLGGYRSDGNIETYTKTKCSWTVHTKFSDGTNSRAHAFTSGHQILIIEEENECFWLFNPLTKVWEELQHLPVCRRAMSAALEGNQLFVIGGQGHETRCDVYNIDLDLWTEMPTLNVGRLFSASSSFQGKIYCCGGRDGDEHLASMEVFDPKAEEKGWSLTASMIVRRREHCLVSCGRYLWAVGGYNGSHYLSSLEKFEPSTNLWTEMNSMARSRAALTASFFDGQLYAIGGGYDGTKSLSTVEVYDPDEDNWITGAPLNSSRYFHASCVVRNMPGTDI